MLRMSGDQALLPPHALMVRCFGAGATLPSYFIASSLMTLYQIKVLDPMEHEVNQNNI
jgi:hypothetical protein